MFAFAQLRAEMSENDAGEGRGWPEINKNLNLGTHQKSHILRLVPGISEERLIISISSGQDFECSNTVILDRGHNFIKKFANSTKINLVPHILVISETHTRRGTWVEEKEESASHHL